MGDDAGVVVSEVEMGGVGFNVVLEKVGERVKDRCSPE